VLALATSDRIVGTSALGLRSPEKLIRYMYMPDFDELSFENLPAYDKVASLPYSPLNCVANARWNCCIEASSAGLLKGTTTMVDIFDDEFV